MEVVQEAHRLALSDLSSQLKVAEDKLANMEMQCNQQLKVRQWNCDTSKFVLLRVLVHTQHSERAPLLLMTLTHV